MRQSYIGHQTCIMDAKGRVAIPSKYRDKLGAKVAIARGRHKNLIVYPMEEWNSIWEELYADVNRETEAEKLDELAFFASQAEDGIEMDKQGRVLISAELRSEYNLTKEVMVIGAGFELQIWAKEEYDAFVEEMKAKRGRKE